MALTIRGLTQAYHDRIVLAGLDLEVAEGEFVCLTGPSGCGKTTLLRTVAGLLPPVSGEVRYRGRAVSPQAGQIGFVFQEDALFPWLNVLGNVELGLRLQGRATAERREVAMRVLERVGLSEYQRHYPRQLSGGTKQRVALARALAYDPPLLLMDEPFASLDSQTRNRLQAELLTLWEKERRTILFVTHNIDEAVYLADRILVLGGRPARLEREYRIGLPRPRRRTSMEFVGIRERVLEEMERLAESDSGRLTGKVG